MQRVTEPEVMDSPQEAIEYDTKLFADSLHAAFTLDEVNELMQQAGLEGVKVYQSSDRHWTAERAVTVK